MSKPRRHQRQHQHCVCKCFESNCCGATVVVLYLEQRSQGKARYARVSIGVARAQTPVKLGRWRWLGLGFTGLLSFWALIVPSLGLSYWFWRGLNQDWAVKTLGAAQTSEIAEMIASGVVTNFTITLDVEEGE